MIIVPGEAAQCRARFHADGLDRCLDASRDPGHRTLEEGRILCILFEEPDELAVLADRPEAQDWNIHQ